MAQKTRAELQSIWITGATMTEILFDDVWDSFHNKLDDSYPAEAQNLSDVLSIGNTASTNIDMNNFGIESLNYIEINTGFTGFVGHQPGRFYWDQDNLSFNMDLGGSGEVSYHAGLENYYIVKNQTGGPIFKGDVVRAAGTLGNSGRILVDRMIADGSITYYFTIGVAAQDIPNGEDGFIQEFGNVRGLDTTGASAGEIWQDGDVLWVSPTISGGLTKTEPSEPNLKIQMAIVIKADANGTLFVRPDLGRRLEDLHDLQTTPGSTGDLIKYNGTYWEYTKSLDGDYQFTGEIGVSGSLGVTGSLTVSSESTLGATTIINGPLLPNSGIDVTGSIDVTNGNVNLLSNSYYFQGTSTGATNVSLIGVNNSDQVVVGNPGYGLVLDDDVFVNFDITVSGGASAAGELYVGGTATINGPLFANSGVNIIGDVGVTGNQTITGYVDIGGTAKISNIPSGSTNTNVLISDLSGNIESRSDILEAGLQTITGVTAATIGTTAGIFQYLVGVDTSTNSVQVSLPPANFGKIIINLKDIGCNSLTNNITILPNGLDTIIDTSIGSTSTTLAADGGAMIFGSNGTDTWWQM